MTTITEIINKAAKVVQYHLIPTTSAERRTCFSINRGAVSFRSTIISIPFTIGLYYSGGQFSKGTADLDRHTLKIQQIRWANGKVTKPYQGPGAGW
jgi:hypothetical protein